MNKKVGGFLPGNILSSLNLNTQYCYVFTEGENPQLQEDIVIDDQLN